MLLFGALCALFGAVVIFRPFTSLAALIVLVSIGMIATGVASFGNARAGEWLPRLAGAAWIALGVAVVAWPELSTRGLALSVGVALIVAGVIDVAQGLRGTTDERIAAAIGGAASATFGVLALAWPDVTLLVVAIVFGARMVVFGLRLAWTAFRDRDGVDRAADVAPGRVRRVGHILVAIVALVAAIGLGSLSANLRDGQPVVDAFYTAPDDGADHAGVLLRSEPYTRDIPDDARAWRILYTTTRDDGDPALASGIVVIPAQPGIEPIPVIAWAHGTTGIARPCAPSILDSGIGAGAFYAMDAVIDQGWALVATDYIGLGTEGPHPYLIGQGEGRSVLDAVRAARQLDDESLANQTVVWGHSQGGHAALWTGQIAPSYAPDVPLAGVAALAPASDLLGLVDSLSTMTGGSIFATYVLSAYIDAYPDINIHDYVRPTAQTAFTAIAGRCLAEPSVFASIITSITTGMSMFTTTDLASGAIHPRLQQNSPTGPIEAPLLIAQGASDSLIAPDVQRAYVDGLCASGQQVDYRVYPGRNHVPLVEPDSTLIPDLIEWTIARFAGDPAVSTCPT